MDKPKIIFFDLETLPDMDAVMEVFPGIGDWPGRTFKATINSIICFGFMEYGDKKAKCVNAWDFKAWKTNVNDDRELCRVIYETLKDAQVVVTQNGKKFDWKFVQTRLMKHGFQILPTIQHVDLKVIAKNNLLLYSNSLKDLAKFFTDDRKMEHEGWGLWVKTRKRDPKAMATMTTYCKQDVQVMVPIYDRLRPFVKELNFNVLLKNGIDKCPACGSYNLRSDGLRSTTTRVYRRYCCKDCGKWSKGNVKDFPKSL